MIDTSLTQSDKAGLSAILGTNPNNVTMIGATNTTNSLTVNTQVAGDRSGIAVASNTLANISTAIPYTFCLPLLSGVIGVNASKMIPVGKLNSPIRLEMFLSANDDAIYYGVLFFPKNIKKISVNLHLRLLLLLLQLF